MDYDFGCVCCDQLDTLEKRLNSLKKSFLKEYKLALNVINKIEGEGVRSQLENDLTNLFNDQIKATSIAWTAMMNNVQKVLVRYL